MEQTRSEHYSGVLVLVLPGRLDECADALQEEPGVTVSIRDPARSRLIAVLESSSAGHLQEMHRRVLQVPGVVTASPIVHYVDEDPDAADPIDSTPPRG